MWVFPGSQTRIVGIMGFIHFQGSYCVFKIIVNICMDFTGNYNQNNINYTQMYFTYCWLLYLGDVVEPLYYILCGKSM